MNAIDLDSIVSVSLQVLAGLSAIGAVSVLFLLLVALPIGLLANAMRAAAHGISRIRWRAIRVMLAWLAIVIVIAFIAVLGFTAFYSGDPLIELVFAGVLTLGFVLGVGLLVRRIWVSVSRPRTVVGSDRKRGS
jgi:hypothetical protein